MGQILLTGGAGYIGSHTAVELVSRGFDVLLLDNFCNSSPVVLERLAAITGRELPCVRIDIRDEAALGELFSRHAIDAVIHFAALKAVGESCSQPLRYFENNIAGTISLLKVMRASECGALVFSSSATVYGDPDGCPIREDAPLRTTNPYGRTKLVMEQLIEDVCTAHADFKAMVLRYFNPVGAHSSGLIGEDPLGIPNNLMPFVAQVAVGRRPRLSVFGGDYPTPDGTGVRDYIHVVDLARAHAAALEYLLREKCSLTVNLGTGCGISVLEMVRAFAAASGRDVPYDIVARRPGDVSECYADPALAQRLLGWKAELGVEAMCEDVWRWQSNNPNGYVT
ncbi:UDP-glucose 4-epimerase GalE [Plasticicumulans acidivorans]|uniref:UDP-glucose 4-epimerase n=1 Tax=Plasticicumulans acidivorans TaxID=886464 RepID=A0A317MN03_9GAMM|nr:UDP-glucose 4-epimerase GalE [Plasticicumulans acidivorans]PWV57713.1 UDP-galactose 4-epimerase [Plasticicumulans acidivorans]